MRYLRNPARTVTAASLKTEEATGVNGQTNIALKIHFVSTAAHHFGDGSWLCKNTLSQGPEWDEVLMRTGLSGFDYARVAAISGCMPIMFITLVRL